jgi:hypothetical protein
MQALVHTYEVHMWHWTGISSALTHRPPWEPGPEDGTLAKDADINFALGLRHKVSRLGKSIVPAMHSRLDVYNSCQQSPCLMSSMIWQSALHLVQYGLIKRTDTMCQIQHAHDHELLLTQLLVCSHLIGIGPPTD